jgi:hypothetical protein
MRIVIEIPDDQVPPSFITPLYPSGYAEDNLHDLLINNSALHIFDNKMLMTISQDVADDHKLAYKDACDAHLAFLKLLQQNMRIESGDSKEKVLIDGLTEVAKDWYDGCPKSMNFVSRTLKLLKTYMGNPK